MHVVDIGTHMGYYTVKLASLAGPSGFSVAFEPNPGMNPFVKRNITRNGLSTTLHEVALGDWIGVAIPVLQPREPRSGELGGGRRF